MDEFLNNLKSNLGNFTVEKILPALIVLVVGLIVIKLICKGVERLNGRLHSNNILRGFFMSLVKIVLYVVLGIAVADILTIPITSLVALVSVAGLAVSLAMQNSLSNVAGGIMLLTSKPFDLGDLVEVDGAVGSIEEIKLLYTRIKTADGKLVFIPNSQISASRIINYTALGTRRVEITVSASYDDACETVETALKNAIAATSLILKNPEPSVAVDSYGESAINYLVWAFCKADDFVAAKAALTKEIRASFDKAGVTMTYNHLNVHLLQS